MAEKSTENRQSNIELLRIVAMLMIITLHYLDKGNVLADFGSMHTSNQYLAWFLEALCYVAVNCYVLISGYFMVNSRFRFRKLVVLWAQILFYSWGIGGIYLLTGMAGEEATGLYELLFVALPVTAGHYWFATIYVLLFAIAPFLNAGIMRMSRAQHGACIGILLVIFSLWNTVLPFTVPVTDREGMDIVWFVCLYMIAAYLRKYPDCLKQKGWFYGLGYFLSGAVVFATGLLMLFIDNVTGKLGGYATNWYSYNSLPVLAGAICLFAMFLKIQIKGKISGRIINGLGGATFGVYLIHEHRYLRYLWPQWVGAEANAGAPWMLLHLLLGVLAVFLVCATIELVRKWIFSLITGRKWFEKIFQPLEKIEGKINGDAK